MKRDDMLTKLLAKANKDDGIIYRNFFEEIVPAELREEVEEFLTEKDVYIFDEEMEETPENTNIDNIVPKNYIGSSSYDFLKSLVKYKRLKPEEEHRLLIAVEKGRCAQKIIEDSQEGELTCADIERLNDLINNSNVARERIIYSYHTYVLDIVNHYVKTGAGGKIQYVDLVQAGFMGLIDAFDNFDCNKDNRLGAWAKFRVMNAIQEEIAAVRNAVAVPKSAQYKRMKIYRIINKFEIEHGRKPTEEEIAKELCAEDGKKNGKQKISIRMLMDSSKPTVNLDMKISQGEESETFDKFIPSETLDPFQEFMREQKGQELRKILLEILSERELFVIYHRFGLDGIEKKTLEELGGDLNLTRERVRQIEEESLNKLRTSSYSQVLFDMLSVR